MARIIWADTAIQDLDTIADYIALDKPEAALRLVQKLLAAVEGFDDSPRWDRLHRNSVACLIAS